MALIDNCFAAFPLTANLNDSTANGYNGTATGTLDFTNDGVTGLGKCATLDTDEGWTNSTSFEANLDGDISLAGFIYVTNNTNYSINLFTSWTGGKLNFLLGLDGNKIYLYRGNGSSQSGPVNSNALNFSNNTWYHIGITISGNTVTFYKSTALSDSSSLGVASGSISYSGAAQNQVAVTRMYTSGGRMQHWHLRSRVLSLSEMTELSKGSIYPFTPSFTPQIIMM